MDTILRFFKPGEFKVCEQYKGENLIAPQLNSVVTLECDFDNVYRVNDVNYVYDAKNVMIDVELRLIEDGYLEKYDTDMNEDEPEDEEDKTDYSALLRNAIADLFGELGVKVEFTKE